MYNVYAKLYVQTVTLSYCTGVTGKSAVFSDSMSVTCTKDYGNEC